MNVVADAKALSQPPSRWAPALTCWDTWNRGDYITLKGTVVLKYFKDPTALTNALLTRTINVIGAVQAPESLPQFEGNGQYQVIQGTTNGEVVLSFNNAKEPNPSPT